MTDDRFAQHNGDALAAQVAAQAQLEEVVDADGWMSAVWYVKDGRVHLLRTTHKFPRGDFALAEAQFKAMNEADAAEDLAVAMALPLPFARTTAMAKSMFGKTSPAVEAVNKAVDKLNGSEPTTPAKAPDEFASELGKIIRDDPLDPVQQMSEEKIKKAVNDETTD